ncbi:transposase, partial [Methylocystis silviterrae]|uniref:transposase n=1 Tax=Methylocystis silviterrae TaxID=2743612 RepID=UPI003C729559
MSVPGAGLITALAFIAAIENLERFKRTRDGTYLALTEKRLPRDNHGEDSHR